MFVIVLRRIFNNKWMFFHTLIATVITVAIFSSIPIYTEGIIQNMLTGDLEINQLNSGEYVGKYLMQSSYQAVYHANSTHNEKFEIQNRKIIKDIVEGIPLPIVTRALNIEIGEKKYVPYKVHTIGNSDKKEWKTHIEALSDIQEHIKITHGTLFSDKVGEGGVYEVIAFENALEVLKMTLGNIYEISNPISLSADNKGKKFKIKVVGTFTYKQRNDPYWFTDSSTYDKSILVDYNLMKEGLLKKEEQEISSAKWFFGYDYHKIKTRDIPTILEVSENNARWLDLQIPSIKYELPIVKVIKQYPDREKKMKIILIMLQTPIFLLLGFFLFMVAQLKIDAESNEIAIIKSRGGSVGLIFAMYIVENGVVGLVALLLGPVLGLFLCTLLGASNGFLDLIQRQTLPVSLNMNTYLYAGVAFAFSFIATILPAFLASNANIVLYKQKKSRDEKVILWKKVYVDIVLIAISLYGLHAYKNQGRYLETSATKTEAVNIDPLLFLMTTLFIFGCGLLILRIFPYFIKGIFLIGRKKWGPELYAAFIQVGRARGTGQFVMLSLILTLSIGVFNASAARTINKNMEEKIRYQVGADIVLSGHWTDNKPEFRDDRDKSKLNEELVYFEPPFEPLTKLKGVESVTKVLKENKASISCKGETVENSTLMGIVPDEFGRTAWFRPDLLPYHWYNYLNLMADSPTALLASTSFKLRYKAKEGDEIIVSWGNNRHIRGVIYAFIDYWPSINPNEKIDFISNRSFIVANLNYIFETFSVEPYNVWLKKKPGIKSSEVYRDITANKIEVDERSDASEQIVKGKNDPMLQGTNGSLTLGFIISLFISLVGFLIYWIISLRKRTLQFGIFRAIGLSQGRILRIIALEQILTTGIPIISGIFVGRITSKLFVPLLQIVLGGEDQVPPFKVVEYSGDFGRMYSILAVMLISAFVVVWRIVSRINISQALKLGED